MTTERKVVLISREGPLDMYNGLAVGVEEDLLDAGVGHVADVVLEIDPERGRAIVVVTGEVCDGEIVVRMLVSLRADGLGEEASSWIAEEGVGELKMKLARNEGRVYLLLVGRKEDKSC